MDYEKAYKEALERAKELHSEDLPTESKDACEYIFPELAENEDEKIRRRIIADIESALNDGDYRYSDEGEDNAKKALAYLEKLKEQKPAEKQDYSGLTDFERAIHRGFLCAGVENVPVEIIKETAQDCLAHIEQKEQIPYIDFVIKPHKGNDDNPYDMSVSEAQDYAIKRGFGIPFNDGEVYVDERHMTQTIGNILRWADEHPKKQKPDIEICPHSIKSKSYSEQKPAEWSEVQEIRGEVQKIRGEVVKDRRGKLFVRASGIRDDLLLGDKVKIYITKEE